MTPFENSATKGRFLLDKRSKFSLQGGSKIVSCDYTSSILVIGQSNGVFSVYNIDTIEAIHSF
jgi:hypothetical protein